MERITSWRYHMTHDWHINISPKCFAIESELSRLLFWKLHDKYLKFFLNFPPFLSGILASLFYTKLEIEYTSLAFK